MALVSPTLLCGARGRGGGAGATERCTSGCIDVIREIRSVAVLAVVEWELTPAVLEQHTHERSSKPACLHAAA